METEKRRFFSQLSKRNEETIQEKAEPMFLICQQLLPIPIEKRELTNLEPKRELIPIVAGQLQDILPIGTLKSIALMTATEIRIALLKRCPALRIQRCVISYTTRGEIWRI